MHTVVDLENWNRKETFEFFSSYEDPFFNVTVQLDVTELVALCKKRGLSLAAACLYYSQESANGIPEFKMRLSGGRLVEYDRVEATQTILLDDESFSFCYLPWQPNLAQYCTSARESVELYKEKRTFDVETGRDDLIYYSVLPWLAFTSFKHATKQGPGQTVPRIVFGKYTVAEGRLRMPLSVEVNHMVMDGLHVGKYVERFQRFLDTCEDSI